MLVDDPDIDVLTVAAGHGRIDASRPLLASLPADERRAILAHERAYLRHHHHRFRLTAELVAAVNPLLRPLAVAIRYSTERWADEAAAAAVEDRAVVARALAPPAFARRRVRRGMGTAALAALVTGYAYDRWRGRVLFLLPALVTLVPVMAYTSASRSPPSESWRGAPRWGCRTPR